MVPIQKLAMYGAIRDCILIEVTPGTGSDGVVYVISLTLRLSSDCMKEVFISRRGINDAARINNKHKFFFKLSVIIGWFSNNHAHSLS